MTGMFDYLNWRGDLTFSQDAVNPVDALIFSTLVYIDFTGCLPEAPEASISLEEAARIFLEGEEPETHCRVKQDLELLKAAAQTRRFGESRLTMYREILLPEEETQFAALTFLLDDLSIFVAYRGTDSTLVGWKEDFNMAFQQSVPSQRLAVQYLRDVSAEYIQPARLGGHSKGGNLAVFAAARSSPMLQRRILSVYNNDGPGFNSYMIGDPGYLNMVPKIHTFIPQSSVIGMLLEHEEPYTVIRSRSIGLLQHDPYSWEINGPALVEVEQVTQSSLFLDATIKEWFAGMTGQERNQLVDVMFTLLGSGGVENALDIFQLKNLRNYWKIFSSDDNLRKVLTSEFQALLDAAQKTKTRFEETQATEALEEAEIPEQTDAPAQ